MYVEVHDHNFVTALVHAFNILRPLGCEELSFMGFSMAVKQVRGKA